MEQKNEPARHVVGGVECTGSYGAGLLRYMQAAGVKALEVTTPDRHDRRSTTYL
jgi:hypothetical protein